MTRPYFHLRGDGYQQPKIDFRALCSHFAELLRAYDERGYFQKAFGYHCVDAGAVSGERGTSLANHLFLDAMIVVKAPVWDNLESLPETQVLGMHEAIFQVVAQPLREYGHFHNYSNCGWHFAKFDVSAGQQEYAESANKHLRLFPPGYKLSDQGVLELLMDEPASSILDSPLPPQTPADVNGRVALAIRRFRRGLSTWDDREAAVRDLGDVLELMRDHVRKHLSKKDENSLFEILNGFAIRHMKKDQKQDYDRPIFLTWFFYEMLAAIHACQRLIERGEAGQGPR